MNSIKIAAGWDGSPMSLTHPEHGWIRFLEARGIAYAAYMRLIPKLRKYNIHGIYEWTYDIHP